ncbi:MAG: hypothetical protein ACRDGD_06770 [Candidatus Limnocylindria bacterium]
MGVVEGIIQSGLDVGTAKWGIVLTAAEEATLDLSGRMHFANQLSEALIPYAESLPIFGGAYIEPARGGGIVINLTEADPAVVAQIQGLAPSPNRGVEVRVVEHPMSDLRSALEKAGGIWDEVSTTRWLSIGVDTERNGLILRVLHDDLDEASAGLDAFEERVGLPVSLSVSESDRELNHHCAVRYDCHNPSRAGALLEDDFIGSNDYCTMGFHILVNGDKQFTTAGHCGYNKPTDWWHKGYGQFGTVAASMYISHDRDLMRVKINDTQISNDIFGSVLQITHARIAIDGETLCASLGKKNVFDCGTVSELWEQYWGFTCQSCPLWGGRIEGLYPVYGDSGSPMYSAQPYGTAIAVGLVSTQLHFPHIKHGLDTWGATIINQ